MIALCPICRKSTDSEKDSDFPFCSERCRLLDLGNWASENYKISSPVFDESELEDAGPSTPGPQRNHGQANDSRGGARGYRR